MLAETVGRIRALKTRVDRLRPSDADWADFSVAVKQLESALCINADALLDAVDAAVVLCAEVRAWRENCVGVARYGTKDEVDAMEVRLNVCRRVTDAHKAIEAIVGVEGQRADVPVTERVAASAGVEFDKFVEDACERFLRVVRAEAADAPEADTVGEIMSDLGRAAGRALAGSPAVPDEDGTDHTIAQLMHDAEVFKQRAANADARLESAEAALEAAEERERVLEQKWQKCCAGARELDAKFARGKQAFEFRKSENDQLRLGVQVLCRIADAFDSGGLDRGENRADNPGRDPGEIEILTGAGGRRLLTVGDCLKARNAMSGWRVDGSTEWPR